MNLFGYDYFRYLKQIMLEQSDGKKRKGMNNILIQITTNKKIKNKRSRRK